MRLGLIGSTGHWQTYAPALRAIPDLQLAAVSAAGPEETTGAFDHAPGLTVETHRYDDPRKMLESEKLDLIQIAARNDRIEHLVAACLERGLPVMADKPLAMDPQGLERLYRLALRTNGRVQPMHTMRGDPALAAIRDAVRAGRVGEPLLSFSQKSYKWGKDRPAYFKSRRTFPGTAAYIGIHAIDWLYWILGDVFVEVTGRESISARRDYAACASHGAFLLSMKNGGAAALTIDYLRPDSAPTHGDERLRIAGTTGVIETVLIDRKVTLVAGRGPEALPLSDPPDIFTQFVRSLRGEGPPPLGREEAFRITEIALKTQQAADTGQPVSLRDSPYVLRV